MLDYDLDKESELKEFISDYVGLWLEHRSSAIKKISIDNDILCGAVVHSFQHFMQDVKDKMTSDNGFDNHKIAAIMAKSMVHHKDKLFLYDGKSHGNGSIAFDCVAYVICMICEINFDDVRYEKSIYAGMYEFLNELADSDNLLSASFVIYLLEKTFPE